jgi:CheY-like chemotaxis protein
MPKKILLIENDQAFAARLQESLESSELDVRATGDGKEGLDLARDWAPDAIVLCVELPSMSGYLVCQKLRKDEALKAIPLVLTSAEATEETFDKHRTLKARADEYLLKPYEPGALLDKLAALLGLSLTAPAAVVEEAEEELVSLEEEIGLEAATGEPEAEIPGLDLQSLPDEPAADGASAPAMDEDLRLLDDAFDGLAAPPAADEAAAALDELTGEQPVAIAEVDAAAASHPDDDEGAARPDLGALDVEAEAALGALGGVDETLSPGLDLGREAGAAPRPRGASADLLRAAGIKLLDDEPAPRAAIVPPPPPDAALAPDRGAQDMDTELRDALAQAREALGAREGEVAQLRRELDALSTRADDAEAELAQARTRAEAAQEKVRKAEAEAKAGRDDARRAAEQARAAEADADDLRRKLADVERRAAAAEDDARRKGEEAAAAAESIARAEALERELDQLRTELLVARSEAEGARGEIDRRTSEMKKRIADLEAANQKNEERVVKAYQKIKADEKVRDKVRKALAIAAQLLEEGAPAEPPAEKERRA